MLSDNHLELMNRALDGELSADEEATWQTLLAENEDVRREFEALQRTAALLDETPAVIPPDDLQARILASISGQELPPVTSGAPAEVPLAVVSSNPVAESRDAGLSAWGYGLAAALVLGLSVFIIDSQFMEDGDLSETDLVGTLVPEADKEAALSSLEKLVSLELSAATPGSIGDGLLISIRTDEPFTLYLEGLPQELEMASTPSEKLIFDRLDSMLVISGWGGEDVKFHYTGSEALPKNFKAKFHTSTKQLSGTVTLDTE